MTDEAQRAELLAQRRSTYNAAADLWPGWSVPENDPDIPTLERGFALAQRSLALTEELELGAVQRATGTWLCGAFELALDERAQAQQTFARARELYIAGDAPGPALLAEGYIAIATGESVDRVCALLADGAFDDGDEFIAQLRVAAQVFT